MPFSIWNVAPAKSLVWPYVPAPAAVQTLLAATVTEQQVLLQHAYRYYG